MDTAGKNTIERDELHYTYWEKFAHFVSQGLSDFFYKLGYKVASYPWTTICISWILLAVTLLGFFNLSYQGQLIDTFIPPNSKFANDTKWFLNSFDEIIRYETIIIKAKNVLDPSILEKAAIISNEIINVSVTARESNKTIRWNDVCLKIPVLIFYILEEEADGELDEGESEESTAVNIDGNYTTKFRPFNPSVDWNSTYFCSLINKLPLSCVQENILDIWKFNVSMVKRLTQKTILQKLNNIDRSPITGHETDYRHLLGGVLRNSAGHIISATSLMINFIVHVNVSHVKDNKILETKLGMDYNYITDNVYLWEGAFNEKMAELAERFTNNSTTIYYSASRSTSDSNFAQMQMATNRMIIGSIIMFLYLQLVLSRVSWVEIRLLVGTTGLLSILMALLSGFGLASGLGCIMTSFHSSIPFLVMGLGVDDMFVVMAGIKKSKKLHAHMPINQQIALTMKNAGTSITITSATDLLVFLVGIFTDIPFLKSYCAYAALNIFMIYIYVITFFVAVLALDERRIKARKNAIMPCMVHSETAAKPCIEVNWLEQLLHLVYSKCILTKLGKLLVITTTITLTGTSLEFIFKLRQDFDITWFIPTDSYHYSFLINKQLLYPNVGSESFVVLRNVNYTEELKKIINLSEQIEQKSDILFDVQSWVRPFQDFVWTYHNRNLKEYNLTNGEWRKYLSQFLFSSAGGKYQANFRFEDKLTCGEDVPNIKISTIDFKFRNLQEREEYLPAKQNLEQTVIDANFTSQESTIWSRIFLFWLTNSVIDAEIFRNIFLSLVGVMLCTGVLIVNLQMCLWILICVLLTLINIGGFMQMWGLSLDLITCVALQMAVGLCVDYAAHIGHTFLSITGETKNERVLETVKYIGPAVIYGGTSTMLVFSALGTIETYAYVAFFRIFLLVVTFGLFHGLVLLPVILSIMGPEPYIKKVAPIKPVLQIATAIPKNDCSTRF